MDGVLTQEELNQLLSVLWDEIDEEVVIKKDKKFHKKAATIQALQGRASKADVIDTTYEPEYTDIEICPTCKRKFNICKAYSGDKRCPHCGQHFNIDLWIS